MFRLSYLFILLFGVRCLALSQAQENCQKCHFVFDKKKILSQQLTFNKEHIRFKFQHLKNEKNCLLCHSEKNTDKLIMLDAQVISFKESPQLCGQCHGPIFYDWKAGIHGKYFGKGTDQEKKFLCVECHNPHTPKFKSMRAEPAPVRPKLGREKNEGEETE